MGKLSMKTFVKILLLALLVISILLSLPSLLKQRDFTTYNDNELRKTAIKKGLKVIPNTFEELLKTSDSKNNPINKEKIALGKELFFNPNLSLNKNTSCSTCHSISKNKTTSKEEQTLMDTNNCVRCH